MEISFELNTVATVGAELARKATKRKRNSTTKNHGPVKQQKFNNGLPFTTTSPSQRDREHSALIEEQDIIEQPVHKYGSDSTTTSSSRAKCKRKSTAGEHRPVQQQKAENVLPGTANSTSQSDQERAASIEEEEIFARPAPELQRSESTITSSSHTKRKRPSMTEDQAPSKQRKLNDGSPLRTSPETSSSPHSLTDVVLSDTVSKSSSPAEEAFSSSTSRSSTPEQTQRNKGGRPRTDKQFPRQNQLRVRTKLRTNRPVVNRIPCEVWQTIFEFCPPDFLLKAVTIEYFDEILQENERSWKVARLREFGYDMPEPPPRISEQEYADLLSGSGCQGCNEKLTRRTYWGFQKRWCDACLARNVAPVRVLAREYAERCARDPEDGAFFEKIVECIPGVRYDSWNHYQWVGDYEYAPRWAKTYPNGQNLRLSRDSFEEWDRIVRTSSLIAASTKEEIEAFFEPYIARNKAFVAKLQEIEGWWMTKKLEKKREVAALKQARETNFKAQALRMDPPLRVEALELCASYKRAKNIAGPCTEKVWSTLKLKLEAERGVAEAEVAARRAAEAEAAARRRR